MSDPDDDDLIAAEFVLGTLDSEARATVEARLPTEDGLRQAIVAWEDKFSPLLGLYGPVEPPSHVWTSIVDRLDGATPALHGYSPSTNILALKRSVQRWRVVASGAMALAAALVGWIVISPAPQQGSRFVAVLQKDAGSPAILLDVDVGARRAMIRRVDADQPVGKSYELWLINPEVGSPRSLGILQPQGITKASLQSFDAQVIARATYAITVEEAGGSTTGAPSGAPILTGKLVSDDR